jgi:hypothetical protein
MTRHFEDNFDGRILEEVGAQPGMQSGNRLGSLDISGTSHLHEKPLLAPWTELASHYRVS